VRKDKIYLALASRVGCIPCLNNGFPDTPAELHHPTKGVGMAQKSEDRKVISLCPIHHRLGGHGELAIHMGIETWEARYGSEEELLVQMLEEVQKVRDMYVI